MARIFEEISKSSANSAGKPDSNLSNDSNNLGGIPAEDYATKKYVQDYHNTKESTQKKYIDEQDKAMLEEAKAYADSVVSEQDFSDFAKLTDVETVKEDLTKEIETCQSNCATNLKDETGKLKESIEQNTTDIDALKENVKTNTSDIETLKEDIDTVKENQSNMSKSIDTLNKGQDDLFQSVSDGKKKIAEAITDKGVTTSATDTFDKMASNINNIPTSSGGGIDTSDDTKYKNFNKTVANLSNEVICLTHGNLIYLRKTIELFEKIIEKLNIN